MNLRARRNRRTEPNETIQFAPTGISTEVYMQIFECLRCHPRFRTKDTMRASRVPTVAGRRAGNTLALDAHTAHTQGAGRNVFDSIESRALGDHILVQAQGIGIGPRTRTLQLSHAAIASPLSMGITVDSPCHAAIQRDPSHITLTLLRYEWRKDDCLEFLSVTLFVGGLLFRLPSPLYAGLTNYFFDTYYSASNYYLHCCVLSV
ncbi:hypothetical protein BOTBODRAFT_38463, partial [Botryobasidium botryosum FD-172 SS1]